jgi:urease accessory protein
VALVQTAAGLLSGDRVGLEIEVGAGAALELTTLAATIAFPAREEARQSLACTVAAGGRFAWLPAPLILAGGCRLASTVELALATGAAAVVRELAVLGRHGETPGACNGALRCDLGGVPLLRDSLLVEPGASRSSVRLGGARAYLSLALLGLDGAAPPGHDELELAGPGRLLRAYGPDAAGVLRTLHAHEPSYLERLWGSGDAA